MEQEERSGREREMLALIGEQKASQVPVKDFCKQHGLSQAAYYYWQKKFRRSQQAGSGQPGGFILLKKEPELSPGGALFAEYKGLKFYQQVSVSFLRELIG